MTKDVVNRSIGIVPRTTQESPRTAQDGPRTCDGPRETRVSFGPVGPIGDPGAPGVSGPCGRSTWEILNEERKRNIDLNRRKMEAARRFVEIARELQLTPADLTDVYTLIEQNSVLTWKD